MSSNKLKVNDEKTEIILCGSKTQREKVSVDAVCVGKSKIPLSSAVRNLGLILDAGVTMQDHMNNTVRGCFYYLRSPGKLRLFLSAKGSKYYSCFCGVVPTCLLQQLLMGGVPSQQLKRPQLVQNTDARTVTRTR